MKSTQAALAVTATSLALASASSAQAGITITQSAAAAPTYSNSVMFTSPAGFNLPTNTWAAEGLSSVVGYDTGSCNVLNLFAVEDGDGNQIYPWAPDSNVLYSPWGIEITFAQAVSSVSFQAWGNGGEPGFFGGAYVNLYDGDYTPGSEVGSGAFTAAWGGVGDTWFNITTTDGSQFDRLVFSNNAMGLPEQFISQISWTNVPGPGSLALIGLAGLVGGRRRRDA